MQVKRPCSGMLVLCFGQDVYARHVGGKALEKLPVVAVKTHWCRASRVQMMRGKGKKERAANHLLIMWQIFQTQRLLVATAPRRTRTVKTTTVIEAMDWSHTIFKRAKPDRLWAHMGPWKRNVLLITLRSEISALW